MKRWNGLSDGAAYLTTGEGRCVDVYIGSSLFNRSHQISKRAYACCTSKITRCHGAACQQTWTEIPAEQEMECGNSRYHKPITLRVGLTCTPGDGVYTVLPCERQNRNISPTRQCRAGNQKKWDGSPDPSVLPLRISAEQGSRLQR